MINTKGIVLTLKIHGPIRRCTIEFATTCNQHEKKFHFFNSIDKVPNFHQKKDEIGFDRV